MTEINPDKNAALEEPEVERDTYEPMSAGHYLATRFSTLKPPMNHAPNPFKLLAMLNRMQWAFFFVGFIAWSWDAFDFFTVSLTVADLAKEFE
jgi:SHS family lactate transporter-like MFS transporter